MSSFKNQDRVAKDVSGLIDCTYAFSEEEELMLSHRHTRSTLIALLLLSLVVTSVLWYLANFTELGKRRQSMPTITPAFQSYLGLDTYRHLDKLPYLEVGDRVVGQSTADPAGRNDDNVQSMRTLTDGEHVLFDQVGPGLVTFMRMQESYGGPWHLSLDGRSVTTIGSDDLGQMQPDSDPAHAFPYPLSLSPQESQGSSIIATTIPFQKSIQWTSQHANGNFYALYRKLPYGTPLTTWSTDATNDDVVNLLRQTHIAPTNIAQEQGNISLSAGTPTVLTTLSGPGQVRALTFHVPAFEMVRFGNARLQIYWDGETKPSVDAPLKFIAGDGAGVYQPAGRPLVQSWLAGINSPDSRSVDFNLYWPMPFSKSARLVIQSDSALQAIDWHVRYEPFLVPANLWGTFHATYSSIPHPVPGQDMTFLDVTGSGKLVGTVINFAEPGPTLEGNPLIYLDDNQTPQIAVTGTEEWGQGGNYWNDGHQVTLPLGGLPSSGNNPPGTDRDGAALYRFLVADSIPFNRHLVVRWQHGSVDQSTNPYRATMLWYDTPTPTALLSDELQLTSTGSRNSHAYHSSSETSYQLSAAYEYSVHRPLLTAPISETSTMSSFTMALNPQNAGAFLRRTFDYCVPNQRANIYVDNRSAGTWYSAGGSNRTDVDGKQRCWRDEEFPLPPSLTAGKTSITIRIEFMQTTNPPDSVWTASHYQLYSFVLPHPNSVVAQQPSMNSEAYRLDISRWLDDTYVRWITRRKGYSYL